MLHWPKETVSARNEIPEWSQPGSNLCLDFHGNPSAANLVVFSDGNHHMALMETLQLFHNNNPDVGEIFYVTTPPGPILQLLRKGGLQIGNFILEVKPNIFFSPPSLLDQLADEGYMQSHVPFMKNRGSVLLIKRGNPKNVRGIADVLRPDVTLFLPNPKREKVSFNGYLNTIRGLAAWDSIDLPFSVDEHPVTGICYGERIHHREAPEVIIAEKADVALVYYHLALRYTRIFPELFDIIPLGGTVEDPQPFPENIVSTTHVGLIDGGGEWGHVFLEFLTSESVGRIYAYHGLSCIMT